MDKYLQSGVSALANTKNKFDRPWFFGHAGASVLAGHFLLKDNEFSKEVRAKITEYLDSILASDPDLFAPADFSLPEASRSEILKCISEVVEVHSTTGHGIIFGALVLKAIAEEPTLFTKEVSEGVIALLRDCTSDVPDRYYGVSNYHSANVDYTGMKTFGSAGKAAEFSLTLHQTIYPDQIIDETYYFLAGNLLHSVTYAHALLQLEELGFGDLVAKGLDPLAKHMFLSARPHPSLEPLVTTHTYDPTEIEFWERSLNEPHQIKLAYSALALTRSFSDKEKKNVYRDLSTYWTYFQ